MKKAPTPESDTGNHRNRISAVLPRSPGTFLAISSNRHNIVVIGAGGSGLSVSYHLCRLGLDHIVLERGKTGNTWQNERWDSFHLVNPNWALRLHGMEYKGPDPDGYLSKAETVKMLVDYATSFSAPVVTETEVTSVERLPVGLHPAHRLR